MLPLLLALSAPSSAADLQLRLTLPDRPPAVVNVEDIQFGEWARMLVPTTKRAHQELRFRVTRVEDAFRVELEVSEHRRRYGKDQVTVVARPVMEAPANRWAHVFFGSELSDLDLISEGSSASPQATAVSVHGTIIDWEIREG